MLVGCCGLRIDFLGKCFPLPTSCIPNNVYIYIYISIISTYCTLSLAQHLWVRLNQSKILIAYSMHLVACISRIAKRKHLKRCQELGNPKSANSVQTVPRRLLVDSLKREKERTHQNTRRRNVLKRFHDMRCETREIRWNPAVFYQCSRFWSSSVPGQNDLHLRNGQWESPSNENLLWPASIWLVTATYCSKMVQILVRQMADVRCNDVCHGIPWCVQNRQTVVQIQRRVDWGISVHQDALRTPETLTLSIVHTHFFSLSPGKIDWLSPIV